MASAGAVAQTNVLLLDELWQAQQADAGAVAQFIKDHDGKPIVEPVPGYPGERRVTFYTLAKKDTDYVMYGGGPDFGGLVMQPLGTSLLRYVTLTLADDARYRYNFSDYKRFPIGATQREVDRSDDRVLEMENAPVQPFIAACAGVLRGELKQHAVASEILGQTRNVSVYTPANYKSGQGHKLLILFDGESYSAAADAGPRTAGWVPTPTILDNLMAEGKIEPTVAIFVSRGRTRNRDLPRDDFGDFVANELIGWARQKYDILPAASDVIIGGSSRGGYAAALIAFRYADKIGNVLSLSGSYWINDQTVQAETDKVRFHFHRLRYPRGDGKMIKLFKASKLLPIRFYMTVGTYDLSLAMVGSNRQLRDILEAKGYSVDYSEFSGGHDYLSWRGLLSDGLISLIGS